MRFSADFRPGPGGPGPEWAHEFGRHFAGMGGRRGHRHRHGGFQSERGSVKYDVLAVLADGPRHGYEIMLAIEERRGIRPSPGSIYPALQMLDDGDFVSSRETEGKRVYTITDKGVEFLKTYRQSPEGAEFDADAPAGVETFVRGMRTLHGLRDAARQLASSGNVELMGRGVEILARARRELYALLAEES